MGVVDKVAETRDFLEECYDELLKVTWPDYEQLKGATLVVILFVFLISGIIWIMDVSSRTSISLIMRMFGAG
jgi:preprotein translocase SecE subunit